MGVSKTKSIVLAKQEERLKTSLKEQEQKIQEMLSWSPQVSLEQGLQKTINCMLNMNEPLVSILMNCYNGENYLQEAINSVLDQSTRKQWHSWMQHRPGAPISCNLRPLEKRSLRLEVGKSTG